MRAIRGNQDGPPATGIRSSVGHRQSRDHRTTVQTGTHRCVPCAAVGQATSCTLRLRLNQRCVFHAGLMVCILLPLKTP